MTTYNSPFTGDVIQPTDVSYLALTMSANVTLAWPVNGNQTGNYAARIMDVTATVGGLSLYMPPANQTSVGMDSLITNKGAQTFSVVNYSGGAIVSIAPGQSRYVFISNNGSEAGTWSSIAFGVGSSSPDAAALAGYGLLASGATLNQSHPVLGVPNGYTFAASDRAQALSWSGGAGSGTLPAAGTLGNNWFCLFKNNGTGTFSIATTGLNTLDGSATKNFQPDESAFIVCDGSNYFTVGYGQTSQYAWNVLVKPVTSGAYTISPSEATNNIQEFVGTLTGNVVVTYPPIVNLYVISNQTTAGTYTLQVTTGIPGSASANIPAGGQATLICDGTNFLNANTVQAGSTQFAVLDGSASNPSIYFNNEINTGIYRPTAGQWGLSILGTNRVTVSATGMTVAGTGTFTGGVAGGTY